MINHGKNGHSNGNGKLVVEDLENLTFSVHRSVFVSPDILEDENRAIFDKCWVYVGHASEIKNPGDFVTRSVAGRPVIFCRDRQGNVRALFNVCRHRGAIVCREREGNTRQFYCIYHGWAYNTDGSIKGIPGDEAYPPNFDKKSKGLVPVPRLEHYKDFYFANLDPDAVDLADLSRRREGLHRSRRRPVAVRTDGNHFRRAGIRHQGELEAAGREQRRRLSPRHHAFDLAELHAQLRRQHHAGQGPHAADQGLRPGPRQRPSHHRQSELSRPSGREMDFGLWRGGQGRHRRHPQGTGRPARRGAGGARRRHQPQSLHLPQSRHQRRLVGDGAPLHAGRRPI